MHPLLIIAIPLGLVILVMIGTASVSVSINRPVRATKILLNAGQPKRILPPVFPPAAQTRGDAAETGWVVCVSCGSNITPTAERLG